MLESSLARAVLQKAAKTATRRGVAISDYYEARGCLKASERRDLIQKRVAETGELSAEIINGLRTDRIAGCGPDNKSRQDEGRYKHSDPSWIQIKSRQYKSIGNADDWKHPGQGDPQLAPLCMMRAHRHTNANGLPHYQSNNHVNQQPNED